MTVWKDVIDWEGYYQVSNNGHVKSVSRIVIRSNDRLYSVSGRVLKQNINSNGYLSITLQRPCKKITLPVYVLVARAFLGPTPNGLEVLHGPAGKSLNDVSNLSFGTHKQNGQDMLRDGLASCKPVLIDGRVFPSISSAARQIGTNPPNLSMSLRRGWKCKGYKVGYK